MASFKLKDTVDTNCCLLLACDCLSQADNVSHDTRGHTFCGETSLNVPSWRTAPASDGLLERLASLKKGVL